MNDRRQKGIEKEIHKILSLSILTEVKNTKIQKNVTLQECKLSKDGKNLSLIFSYLNITNKDKLLEELNKLKGFFRTKIAKEINLRYTPEINVLIDNSIEASVKMSKLLDSLKKTEE